MFGWACVAFRKIPVNWKGGNHAPLSRSSRIVLAVAGTAWCLAAFRFYPLFFAGLFGASLLIGISQSTRDRSAFDSARGIIQSRPKAPTIAEYWLALCLLDSFFFAMSLYAVLRDLRHPSHTDEQHIVHVMGIGYLVASVVGAVYLYVKRPRPD